MQTGLVHLHNLLRWVIIILLLLSIVKSYTGWQSKKVFSPGDKKTWLFTMIAGHITLLIGLYQLLWGRYGILVTDLPAGTSAMKDKFFRFFWVEHPTGMILSIVLITLGYGMAKKPVADEIKYKKAFWFFIIALVVILATVPWPFRDIVGRPLFPGM
jgi:hypothetical protein